MRSISESPWNKIKRFDISGEGLGKVRVKIRVPTSDDAANTPNINSSGVFTRAK